MQTSTTNTGVPGQSVQSAQTQWAELAVIAKRVVGDNHLVHANTALAIALRQVMSAVLLPDPQYNKGSPGHYKIDELCSWSGKLPDGRTVALEGHCIALTPAGKPRLHPEALDKDTAASSKVSDWNTLNEGKASVDHDGADPIKQSYNRRVMLMGQKRHTQWIKTPMVPRFRPHPSQRLFEGAFIKRQPKGAENQIVEVSHGGNSGISRSANDPAVTGEHTGSASPSVAFDDVGSISETLDGALHDCSCG